MAEDDLENLRPLKPGEGIKNVKGPSRGTVSTERSRTVQNPDGTWMNVNSLWMNDKTKTISDYRHLDDDQIAAMGRAYEAKSKTKYQRYSKLEDAVTAAQERTKAGGANSGAPLAVPLSSLKP